MAHRSWLVTGVSSGFGRIMAERLLVRGDRVAGTVRDLSVMRGLKARHGDRLWLADLDVSETPAIRGVVDRAWAEFGRIDVVVSNAGYGLMGAAEEFTDEQVRHQVDVNLLGSIQLIRAALPHLRAQGGGRILQVSSSGGQAAVPGGSLYHGTNWGIEGFVDAVAQEVAVFGIGCTIVEPGSARTDFRHRGAKVVATLAAYDASPARALGRMVADPSRLSLGDPAKMVEAMIHSVEQDPAPRRLALGSDAYELIARAVLRSAGNARTAARTGLLDGLSGGVKSGCQGRPLRRRRASGRAAGGRTGWLDARSSWRLWLRCWPTAGVTTGRRIAVSGCAGGDRRGPLLFVRCGAALVR